MDKTYDFRTVEPRMQRLWAQLDLYRFQGGAQRPIFSIDTPPPTVSGRLHIGHVFSYTQAEMIARYKRMRGYDVFYPFGYDDNGLPTERLVERECGVLARDLPREEFSALCQRVSADYEEQFRALWDRLGFSVDWSQQYRTVSPETIRIAQAAFLELAQQGHAYVKQSPVLWCPGCRTSIAQAELDSVQAESAFHTLRFDTDRGALDVATTRPELLGGCVCLLVHPEDGRYRAYVGGSARVPLYGDVIPILADPDVDPGKGTGAVMCATYGDATDVAWAARYGLPYRRVIAEDGRIDPGVPFIGGMALPLARERIVALLAEGGALIASEPVTHLIAAHERCGHATEILPSRQWYIDILTQKARYLAAADEIDWRPTAMKARYLEWVGGLKWDWCISRQRYFGVPFPVWYCKACGKPILARTDQLPVNPLTDAPEGPCACGCRQFTPESAVMDTWATSSLTPLINARHGLPGDRGETLLPMSLRTQAHEIIRTWAFYTIVRSLYHTGKLPWKQIMISGFVLAKSGEKYSKSKSQGADMPMDLIETHSADALRYWSASAKLGTDTFFSQQDLQGAKRVMTKLYNAARFARGLMGEDAPAGRGEAIAEARAADPDAARTAASAKAQADHPAAIQGEEPAEALLPVDAWLLARLDQTTRQAADLLDAYEAGAARRLIDAFFWEDLCDNYIEIAKERLYQPDKHGRAAAASGRYALYHGLLGVLKLYAPYMPHLTEHLYQEIFRSGQNAASLHQLQWDCSGQDDAALLALGELIKGAVGEARRNKSERGLSLKSEMERLVIPCPDALRPMMARSLGDLTACTHARRIELIPFTNSPGPLQ